MRQPHRRRKALLAEESPGEAARAIARALEFLRDEADALGMADLRAGIEAARRAACRRSGSDLRQDC